MLYLDLAEKGEVAIGNVLVLANSWVPPRGAPEAEIRRSFSPITTSEALATTGIVVIRCLGGPEDGMNSGNERLSFSVRVLTPTYADDRDNPDSAGRDAFEVHRERVGMVFDVLKRSDIATLLTEAVENFTVFDSVQFRRGAQDVDRKEKGIASRFISELIMTMSCAPSRIADSLPD